MVIKGPKHVASHTIRHDVFDENCFIILVYIHIKINNISYNISTPARSNTSESSSVSLILLFCYNFSTMEVKDNQIH